MLYTLNAGVVFNLKFRLQYNSVCEDMEVYFIIRKTSLKQKRFFFEFLRIYFPKNVDTILWIG